MHVCNVLGSTCRCPRFCWSTSFTSGCRSTFSERACSDSRNQSGHSTLVGIDWFHRCARHSRIWPRSSRSRSWHAYSFVRFASVRPTSTRRFCRARRRRTVQSTTSRTATNVCCRTGYQLVRIVCTLDFAWWDSRPFCYR